MRNEMGYDAQNMIGSILSDMSDGILVIGTDGTILLHNAAAVQFLGLHTGSLQGQALNDVLAQASDDDPFLQAVRDAVRQKARTSKTVPYFHGEEMRYLRIITDVLRADGAPIGVIIQITDSTDATAIFTASNARYGNTHAESAASRL